MARIRQTALSLRGRSVRMPLSPVKDKNVFYNRLIGFPRKPHSPTANLFPITLDVGGCRGFQSPVASTQSQKALNALLAAKAIPDDAAGQYGGWGPVVTAVMEHLGATRGNHGSAGLGRRSRNQGPCSWPARAAWQPRPPGRQGGAGARSVPPWTWAMLPPPLIPPARKLGTPDAGHGLLLLRKCGAL